MEYLTATDKVVLLSGGVGIAVGLVASAQDVGFDWWLKKEWLGTDRAISRAIVSAIVWALVLSAIAFLTILYEPMKSLSDIQHDILQLGLGLGLLLPSITRASTWAIDTLTKTGEEH